MRGVVSDDILVRRGRHDRHPLHDTCSSGLVTDVNLPETSHQKYTKREPQDPVDGFLASKSFAPSIFLWSLLNGTALGTTTRGSSVCRPDGEAEARGRFVALCSAKQGSQGFVAEQKNHQLFWHIVAG